MVVFRIFIGRRSCKLHNRDKREELKRRPLCAQKYYINGGLHDAFSHGDKRSFFLLLGPSLRILFLPPRGSTVRCLRPFTSVFPFSPSSLLVVQGGHLLFLFLVIKGVQSGPVSIPKMVVPPVKISEHIFDLRGETS